MPGIVPDVPVDGLGDGDPAMSMPGMLGLIVGGVEAGGVEAGGVEAGGVEPTGCPQAATMVVSATRAATAVRRRVMGETSSGGGFEDGTLQRRRVSEPCERERRAARSAQIEAIGTCSKYTAGP